MSDYWDAVLGAAFGLPGTARPGQRPRPLDDPEDGGLPVEIEEFRDAPLHPAVPRQVPRQVQVSTTTPEPASPGERARSAPLPIESSTATAGAAEPEVPRPAGQSPIVPQAAPPAAPAPAEAPAETAFRSRESTAQLPVEPVRALPAPAVSLASVETAAAVAVHPALPPAIEKERTQALAPHHAQPPVERPTIPAEPVAPPAPSAGKEDEQAAPPMLTIEIGRIDIRIEPPQAPPRPIAAKPAALPDSVPSLADYLARRSEAGR